MVMPLATVWLRASSLSHPVARPVAGDVDDLAGALEAAVLEESRAEIDGTANRRVVRGAQMAQPRRSQYSPTRLSPLMPDPCRVLQRLLQTAHRENQ